MSFWQTNWNMKIYGIDSQMENDSVASHLKQKILISEYNCLPKEVILIVFFMCNKFRSSVLNSPN